MNNLRLVAETGDLQCHVGAVRADIDALVADIIAFQAADGLCPSKFFHIIVNRFDRVNQNTLLVKDVGLFAQIIEETIALFPFPAAILFSANRVGNHAPFGNGLHDGRGASAAVTARM